jgi:hypothetical protein
MDIWFVHVLLSEDGGRELALGALTFEGQQATVLQLPAESRTAVEAQTQRRVAYIA